jgi:hypothetical protein
MRLTPSSTRAEPSRAIAVIVMGAVSPAATGNAHPATELDLPHSQTPPFRALTLANKLCANKAASSKRWLATHAGFRALVKFPIHSKYPRVFRSYRCSKFHGLTNSAEIAVESLFRLFSALAKLH